MSSHRVLGGAILLLAATFLIVAPAQAKNPIRTAFFNYYPTADGTQLNSLPSNSDHCGLCHFDFNGGGPRNLYGAKVDSLRNIEGLSSEQAFAVLDPLDSDGDGFTNHDEVLDLGYANTPTFPGYTADNVAGVLNVSVGEVSPHVTPTMGVDEDPPTVVVTYPAGGEAVTAENTVGITWTADDPSGISSVEIYHSLDGGSSWKPLTRSMAHTGTWSWFVPNRPGSANLIRVEATDGAGNEGYGASATTFTVNQAPAGRVPSTLRDVDLPGTQPVQGPLLADPDGNCATCHGNYDPAVEPWYNWGGSPMAQSARDPIFYACLAVAEQDVSSVGDLCLRCHSPRGWLDGRSNDTSGQSLTLEDREGISCDFCHKLVDFDYVEGVSPAEDQAILNELDAAPTEFGSGQYVAATTAPKRGPFADALEAGHSNLESPFHSSGELCGICHDVSNPAFSKVDDGDYAPNAWDTEHPSGLAAEMLPVERTYSEWANSDFAAGGVDLPQWGGVVSTCVDCHMRNVTGAGANVEGTPIRTNLPLHDMTGGNAVLQDMVADLYPDEIVPAQLEAAKNRALDTLTKAARLELATDAAGVTVRVYNDTGHKLPTGYPEGRRIWLEVEAYDMDNGNEVVFASGAYDFGTGVLDHDEYAKIYQIKPGFSPALGAALSLPAGPSFHFVLNDTVYADNRIPPRGFTNAAFEQLQMPPVDHSYADGQYWDDTFYPLPNTADSVRVRLYYQAMSKEYVEFLQAENTTTDEGQILYDVWDANGRGAPSLMAEARAAVEILTAVDDTHAGLQYSLGRLAPNPFQNRTAFHFSVARPGWVRLAVYDVRGRQVRVLENEIRPAGAYTMHWDGKDDRGATLASGVYFLRFQSGDYVASQRVVLVR